MSLKNLRLFLNVQRTSVICVRKFSFDFPFPMPKPNKYPLMLMDNIPRRSVPSFSELMHVRSEMTDKLRTVDPNFDYDEAKEGFKQVKIFLIMK